MRPLSYICRCLTGGAACGSCSAEDTVADAKSKSSSATGLVKNKKSAPVIKDVIDGITALDSPGLEDDDEHNKNATVSKTSVSTLLKNSASSAECFKPPSFAENQMPIFQCLATQLKEAQTIIQKLEIQAFEQDKIIKDRAEAACRREQLLEAKLRELQKKTDSAEAIGHAAKTLESVTENIQSKLSEAQDLRLQLTAAEERVRLLKEENQQMKVCIECMKTKMLEAEECGAKTAQNWKLECEKLKSDVCCLRSAAEDLCEQLHEANKKCTRLEGVQTRLRDTCDVSSSADDNESVVDATARSQMKTEVTPRVSMNQSLVAEAQTRSSTSSRAHRGVKRKYEDDFHQLAEKLQQKEKVRRNDWHRQQGTTCGSNHPAGWAAARLFLAPESTLTSDEDDDVGDDDEGLENCTNRIAGHHFH